MELLQEKGAIHKVVIMPTTGEFTVLQGFDVGILNSEVAEILFLLSKAPKELKDIFVSESHRVDDTLNAQNPITLISKENIENIPNIYHMPFCLIFCVKEDFSYVSKIAKKFEVPPIICCNNKAADIRLNEINSIFSFDKALYSRLKMLENMIRKSTGERKISNNLKRRGFLFKSSNWSSTLNNVTLPNELLMESIGYMLSRPKRIKDGSSKREFINIITDSVDACINCMEELNIAPPVEILLYAPGMHSFLYDKDNDFYELVGEELNLDEKRFLINGVLRNPAYSGIRLEIKEHKVKESFKNPLFNYLISLRRSEMRLTTAAISLLSLHKKTPAIRMPNSINHHGNILKRIEEQAVKIGIYSPGFIRTAKVFNTVIRRAMGNKLRSYITDTFNDISFVCDVPLDWVRFGGLPVMFSHEISRINATPGNILLQNASFFPRTVINASALKKVLVIRSFQPDDPLKFLLESALDTFRRHMPDLSCEIIDVNSNAEFIDALNQYNGYLLVMDCHGDHGGDVGHGWLIIGDEKIDTWHLNKVARIPPVVILSACLTSALSGSHASVANGFMVSGALSVIGTLLPVNAMDSAVFVSRLIFRLYEFPSAIPKDYSHVNMRLLLSIFLRMSYATDLIRGLEREGLIAKDSWQEDAIDINTYINMLNQDWFSYTIEKLAKLTELEEGEVLNIIEERLYITETMCYSQIGFPESITVRLRE
ncbi:CHAT domain protein [Pantoea agglomerans]|uniref:CHAT domain protein n=1 Tax=Enterobacter agglomerans TaxID=549 RepID=UPI0028997B66|nr:CHAT domain protein [Pantoea agglomerans]WNK34956.1 CHAT domain protein [Pantoea agglomerans]